MNVATLFYVLVCLIAFWYFYLFVKKTHSEEEKIATEIFSELSIIISAILFGVLLKDLVGTNLAFLIPALLLLLAGIALRIFLK